MTHRALVTAFLAAVLGAWRFHPIHAARLEIRAAPDGSVTGVVHVYRDDFPPGSDLRAIDAYLGRVLIVTDAAGRRVPLRPIGAEPEGDRLRIGLAGRAAGPLSGGRILVSLLQDRYADQVDVVDATTPGHRAQLVFLRGDRAQALP